MSSLSDHYLERYSLEEVEDKIWYLSALALDASFEVDSISREEIEFEHLNGFVEVLKKYQLSDDTNGNDIMRSRFQYFALTDAMKKNSDKELRHFSEIALEMKLLTMELESVSSGAGNPKKVLGYLNDITASFIDKDHNTRFTRHLVA